MGTISAKKITDALAKAKDVGVVEDGLTIGDVALVLRNLRPDEYTAIYEENKEKESIDHLFSFQKAHICRSIIEINGVDLREVDFVEVEEEVKDPKTGEPQLDGQGNTKFKKVKLERHEYVRRYVVDGWTKEPVQIIWRKFGDVLKLAEDKAKAGVKFVLPEQTPEEKFREAIGNAREVIDEVPAKLAEAILEEAGFMLVSTAEEVKRAMETADQIAREQEAQQRIAEAAQEAAGQPQAPQGPQEAPPQGPQMRRATPEEIMARRSPMNRQAVEVPSPTQQPVIASPQTRQGPPQGPPQPPPQVSGADAVGAADRAQKIARLEAESLDMEVPLPPPGDPSMAQRHIAPGQGVQSVQTTAHAPNAPHLQVAAGQNAPVLEKKAPGFDKQAFEQNLNPPPRAGINPRFRAPR